MATVDPSLSPQQQLRRARARAVIEQMRSRGRWWLVGVVAIVVLLVAAFPQLVAHSPLKDKLLGSATEGIDGEIHVGRLSLGWFSKPALYDVEVLDARGQRVAIVPEATVDKSLWSLLSNSSRLGRVRLQQPEVLVELTEDGSNIEDLLAPLLESEDSATLDCPEVSLEVIDGRVLVYDGRSRQEWKLEDVNATVALGEDWSAPLQVDCTAVAPLGDGEAPLRAEAVIERGLGANGAVNSQGRLAIRGEQIPLDMLQPLAARAIPGLKLAGSMNSNLRYEWVAEDGLAARALVEGSLAGDDLVLAAKALGQDVVRLDRWRLPCRMVRSGDQLTVERLALECDVGHCELQGPLTLRLDEDLSTEVAAALVGDAYQIEGQVDLARVAALLPQTLRIREGTQITSGQAQWSLAHRSSEQGAVWEGKGEVSSLEAENQGKKLSWKKPIQIEIAARDGDAGPVIDRLVWQSSFLQLEAQGTLDYVEATAEYKLSELARQLSQFVNLGSWQLAGDGWGHVAWRRGENGHFEVDGTFQVQGLSLGDAGGRLWTEENLNLDLTVVGQSEGRQIRRVDTGLLDLESGNDKATVKLLKPVADPTRNSPWQLDVAATGQLATWVPRLEPIVAGLEGWELAGSGKLTGKATVSADKTALDGATIALSQFRVRGGGLFVDEPNVELRVSGQWDSAAGRFVLPEAQFKSRAVNLTAKEVVCELPDGRFQELRGKLAWNGDLARLQAWVTNPQIAPAWTASGAIAGRMDFTKAQQATTGKLVAAIDDLVLVDAQDRQWRETRVDLSANGQFDRAQDSLQLEKLVLEADTLRCDAAGQVAEVHGRRNVDLRGQLDYDTEKLMELLRPWLGEYVLVEADRQAREFALSGPLRPTPVDEPLGRGRRRPSTLPGESLTAEAGVGWTGANVYGFLVGPSEVPLHYSSGVLQTGPIELVVSDGMLRSQPRLVLSDGPARLIVPKGEVLHDVKINRDMTYTWLGYVMPALAGVGEAEGTFSAEIDEWRVPLTAPATADLSGRVTLENVEVEAGPLLKEIVFVADTVRRLILKKPMRQPGQGLPPVKMSQASVVSVRMVEGRIYHKDLSLAFDDVTIRTYGSVGLDETLALMVELPIPDKWVGTGAAASALRGRVFRVPIGGTLERPKIDQQAFQQETGKLAQRGVEGLLLEGVNRGLDDLLNRPR
jgi:hypothetical protein